MFQLRDIDDQLWGRAATRAQLEGWPLRDLMLSFLKGYADGTIVPPGPPPRPRPPERDGVVELRFTCPKCNKSMVVDVTARRGFSYMGFYAVECPSCSKITERALPGDIVEIRRG